MEMSAASFDYIRRLLRDRAGIELDRTKRYLVESRLAPIAQREQCTSLDALVHRLREPGNGLLAEDVVEAMTTNETSFFRDGAPFTTLRDVILPQLLRSDRALRQLTIWCAACSTGQEVYSIAMLIREHFATVSDWQIRVLGSDLSQRALQQARAGCYNSLEIARGLSVALRDKYFRWHDDTWCVTESLRSLVEFRRINLAADWPPLPMMDVVFVRNVMVYFDSATKRKILGRVRRRLRPGGYLFLGGAETTLNLDNSFKRLRHAGFSYYTK